MEGAVDKSVKGTSSPWKLKKKRDEYQLEPVLWAFIALVEENGWQERVEDSIRLARSYNIPRLYPIEDGEDFVVWMNDAILHWVPVENYAGKEIYDRICLFYFIFDQPPLRELQNKIIPAEQAPPLTPLSLWLRDFADAWGAFLDTTESITLESVKTFYESPRFNLDEYMPPPSGYKTFNQLFARQVKPGMRPIAAISDPRIIASAADSTFVGWWQINEHSKITVKNIEWSIFELLDGSPYADRFKGGIFAHSFLNTTDYHRLHVPVPGVVLESRTILGQVYLDVTAVPVSEDENGTVTRSLQAVRTFDAQDGTGYQFAQARGLIIIESPIGLVAVLPIGMAQVSSVVMTAEKGKTLYKGQEFAYFQFGGSDHVMLFEAASNVSLTAQPNVHYNQGQAIGQAFP